MNILSIMAAPSPKKALLYDNEKDELVFERADIIGLIEMENPDNPGELATMPMYMCHDSFGVYFVPQLSMNFIEFVDDLDNIDLGKYNEQVKDIKKFYEEVLSDIETVEVESKGNVSHIRRIIRNKKPTEPKE